MMPTDDEHREPEDDEVADNERPGTALDHVRRRLANLTNEVHANTHVTSQLGTELSRLRIELAGMTGSIHESRNNSAAALLAVNELAAALRTGITPVPDLGTTKIPPLGPMRAKEITLSDWRPDWRVLIDDIVDAASTRTKTIPSERVREVFDEMSKKARLAALEAEENERKARIADEAAWRKKFRRRIAWTISAGTVTLVFAVAGAYLKGHVDERSAAPLTHSAH